ncbi:class E sortase [Nocardioides cavernae]|uniref:Class E sortase n=1 Tax=Nocardioides cavernae TaxID=1921566 RepID=A0ABR8NF38_9ACTN|nr:class E sortase [Nocardioides cavernae]
MVRTTAELLLTLGLVVVAFAAYLVVWSDVQNAAAQSTLRETFEARVAQASRTSPSTPAPRARPAARGRSRTPVATAPLAPPPTGGGLGLLSIPRLGQGWSRVIVEGVETDQLALGPGHFPGTAMPGEVGNFAVAGHRATNGEPFAHLDALVPGDEVTVQTLAATFTYVVDRSELVTPTATEVLEPVPGRPGATPRKALLTLVTCHPRWGSSERLIVSGHLVDRAPTTGGA